MVYGTPGIGASGTSKLAQVLPFNKTLEILDLTSNAIGDDGASGLSIAFVPNKDMEKENEKVTEVIDSDSQLTFDSLDTVWRPNTTLRSLLLSGNGIGPSGAQSLAKIVSYRMNSIAIFVYLYSQFDFVSINPHHCILY